MAQYDSKKVYVKIPAMNLAAQLFPSPRESLLERFQSKLEIAHNLDRKTVSFQANKTEPLYRWFKYKEGFSSSLVRYFLREYGPSHGVLLDPFAGAGTALFAAKELGWSAVGIELLPVGTFAIRAREAIEEINLNQLKKAVDNLNGHLTKIANPGVVFEHLTITREAFPEDTETVLNAYLTYCSKISDLQLRTIFRFAAFSVLEEVSYTRKDGQYLRWDHRSQRDLSGKPFDKGRIPNFLDAIQSKLNQIVSDLSPGNTLFPVNEHTECGTGKIEVEDGSCLELLPKYLKNQFDFVITSPPYCNRYDYTRTYALELAFLGLNDEAVRKLRQQMLSCTVENKEKIAALEDQYSLAGQSEAFLKVMSTYLRSEAMNEINMILEKLRESDQLNNKNIARMVKNYFLEMCFVIYELGRVTKPGGHCIMVNDNVRYGGEEIPADLILSEFAQGLGFSVEKILVLPRGKGNSSQQMGAFGRSEIRKCVYVWRKE